MPAPLALKTSNQESIARKRQEFEATKAERLATLGPHLELLNRLKALLPPDSPDIRAIDALYIQVEMTPTETARAASRVARWQVHGKQSVLARMKSAAVA